MNPLKNLGPMDLLRLTGAVTRRMARQEAERIVRASAKAEQEAILNEQPALLDIVAFRRTCSPARPSGAEPRWKREMRKDGER